ncbi:MAG: SDR family oxidoreductase [Burkholderiales bacterium]
MDLQLAGKSVIVTGSGSNIGRAIALAFAREGAKVAIADIDVRQCEKVAQLARETGAKEVLAMPTDVTNWEQVQRLASSVEEQFGAIDVLVNNVGWTVDRLFMEKPREEWEKEIQLNLWSNINCTRAVLDAMVKAGRGSVVNIGSDAGRMGEFREAVYGATKAGVIALAKSLAREYGRKGVRFNTVCPGTTLPDSDEEIGERSIWATGMKDWNTPEMRERIAKAYPLRRVGRPDDISNAVLFMASGCSSFITGQTLSVSGGYTMM